uniref:Gap junction protein n=1 Tax=Eptatretus burgeri TaxID=7764 RepID=A0A8C4N3G2_EPTBU
MDWAHLFSTINVISKYSTVIGRIWLSVIFVFRVLVLVVAAQSVWHDEQSDFQCNTLQPGCKNVCFDHFFPILHVRLWALQLIFVATPTMLVVMHVSSRYRREKKKGKHGEATLAKIDGGLLYTYLLSILCRIGFETAFLYIFYALYSTYHMPRLLNCQVSPCPQIVECFVARPTEKTIFTVFMLLASVICLLLNIAEVIYLVIKRILFSFKKAGMQFKAKTEDVSKDYRKGNFEQYLSKPKSGNL